MPDKYTWVLILLLAKLPRLPMGCYIISLSGWVSHPHAEKVSAMNDPNSRSSRDVMRYDIVIFCHVRLALNKYILSELLFALFLVFTEKSLPDLDANPSILSTAKNMTKIYTCSRFEHRLLLNIELYWYWVAGIFEIDWICKLEIAYVYY